MELGTISTGSKAIDAMIGGGVRQGLLTDIYGESGSGKSQLCFTLSVNCARTGCNALYIDTAGTFRPERIAEIAGTEDILEKITFVRVLNTYDQSNAIKKIIESCPKLVVVDTLTSLFSSEYSGPSRHLAVMRHLHELAVLAINLRCAIVVTNMVRNVPITVADQAGHDITQAIIPSLREYLGSSISIYSHIKIKLEIVNATRSLFQATLVQPRGKNVVPFTILPTGFSDIK